MPNWCQNSLVVKGDKKEIKKLMEFVKGKDENDDEIPFDFNKILPTPEELMKHEAPIRDKKIAKKLEKKYGAEDWYQWRVNNWGTKWTLDDNFSWETKGNELFSGFDTAWAPPTGIIRKLGETFPKLSFTLRYAEAGACFAGEYYINGEEENDLCYSAEDDRVSYNEIASEFGCEIVEDEEDAE